LAALAIDAGRNERGSGPTGGAAMRSMREGLVRLSEDMHAFRIASIPPPRRPRLDRSVESRVRA